MARILAIDYGEKRLGIAVSDETKKIAFSKPFIPASDLKKLWDLVADREIDEIVLGLPNNLQGQETGAAKKVREFAARIQKKTAIPVRFQDERYTTREATESLHEQGIRGARARGAVDSRSAQILLQAYLRKNKN